MIRPAPRTQRFGGSITNRGVVCKSKIIIGALIGENFVLFKNIHCWALRRGKYYFVFVKAARSSIEEGFFDFRRQFTSNFPDIPLTSE